MGVLGVCGKLADDPVLIPINFPDAEYIFNNDLLKECVPNSDKLFMKSKSAVIIESFSTGQNNWEQKLHSVGIEDISRVAIRDVSGENRFAGIDMVVYDCEHLTGTQIQWLLPLSERSRLTQFLVLSKQISILAYKQVAKMNNIVTLQVPTSDELFQAVVQEILNQGLTHPQKFPRFVTDEPARMVVMESGLLIPTRMRNYSMGGAFLEYKGISLKVGHSLKVSLLSQESGGTDPKLQLNAKVVWIKDQPQYPQGPKEVRGVGVQFIDL